MRLANGGAVTRGHFARFLVECGKAATMADVFKKYSRLIRVRYGDIPLPKGLPRGGWTELDLAQTNYLRGLVELPPETSSKVGA